MGCSASVDQARPAATNMTTRQDTAPEPTTKPTADGSPPPNTNARAGGEPASAPGANEILAAAGEQRAHGRASHPVEEVLDAAKAAIQAGGQLATEALADAQQLQAEGRAGPQPPPPGSSSSSSSVGIARRAATGVAAAITQLSGNDDVRLIVGGSWVLLSESAKFFTIGRVVVTVLEQIYAMWNAWSSKNRWVGEFIAFLKLVEIDLVAGVKTFEHVDFLKALRTQLESARDLLAAIQGRTRGLAFLMAMADEAALGRQRDLIDQRKNECLFGHAVEIKRTTKESLVLLQELSDLIQERHRTRLQLEECPEGPEARREHEEALARAFGAGPAEEAADGGGFIEDQRREVERLQDLWMVAVRRRRWKRMGRQQQRQQRRIEHNGETVAKEGENEEAREGVVAHDQPAAAAAGEQEAAADADAELRRYVEQYLSDAIHIVPTSQAEARASVAPMAHTAADAADDTAAAAAIAAHELAFFRSLTPDDQARQVQQLRADLADVLHTMQQQQREDPSSTTTTSSSFERALASACQAYALVDSLKNLAAGGATGGAEGDANDASSCLGLASESEQVLFDAIVSIRRAQAARGDILTSRTPTLDQLLAFTRPPATTGEQAAGERTIYYEAFRAHYARELAHIEWVTTSEEEDAEGAAAKKKVKRTADMPTKGKLLLIKAPPGGVAAGHTQPGGAAPCARDLSCSIFLAFLVDLYPRTFRAVHFAAPPPPSTSNALASPPAAASAGSSSLDRADLHRIFPSLAYQLAQQQPDFAAYFAHLRACWNTLTRDEFRQMEPQDFIVDLFGAKFERQGSKQTNPNATAGTDADADLAGAGVGVAGERGRVSKVCFALDGGQFAWSTPPPSAAAGSVVPLEFASSLVTAATKQTKESLPPWLTLVLTLPATMTQLERKAVALGHQPLQLSKLAIETDDEDDSE